jgi:hypothetical protein
MVWGRHPHVSGAAARTGGGLVPPCVSYTVESRVGDRVSGRESVHLGGTVGPTASTARYACRSTMRRVGEWAPELDRAGWEGKGEPGSPTPPSAQGTTTNDGGGGEKERANAGGVRHHETPRAFGIGAWINREGGDWRTKLQGHMYSPAMLRWHARITASQQLLRRDPQAHQGA